MAGAVIETAAHAGGPILGKTTPTRKEGPRGGRSRCVADSPAILGQIWEHHQIPYYRVRFQLRRMLACV